MLNKGDTTMKKKAAIVTIIITFTIIWILSALAVCFRQTQYQSFTIPIKEANSGVTRVKSSIEPLTFLPVGNDCEFTISVTGPEEITSKISISLGSPKAEPIFSTTASNSTISTGKLNVNNEKMFVNFNYEPIPELDEDKTYSVKYTIELTSGNYALFNGIIVAVTTLCIIPMGISISYLVNLEENDAKAYDERQSRMRGKAAMSTLIVVILTAMGLGMLSIICNGYPLSVYESLMAVVFIGIATFAITADRHDAYTKLKGKRIPFATAFTIIGIIDLVLFFISISAALNGGSSSNILSPLVQGLCCLAIGIEMISKNIKDKKEALADEES